MKAKLAMFESAVDEKQEEEKKAPPKRRFKKGKGKGKGKGQGKGKTKKAPQTQQQHNNTSTNSGKRSTQKKRDTRVNFANDVVFTPKTPRGKGRVTLSEVCNNVYVYSITKTQHTAHTTHHT